MYISRSYLRCTLNKTPYTYSYQVLMQVNVNEYLLTLKKSELVEPCQMLAKLPLHNEFLARSSVIEINSDPNLSNLIRWPWFN